MKPRCSLRKALADLKLLGHALVGDSWIVWRILLIAAVGEQLTDGERAVFKKITGRAHEPGKSVHELVAIVGRRGGKSYAMACCFAGWHASMIIGIPWRRAKWASRSASAVTSASPRSFSTTSKAFFPAAPTCAG
jgi:hypothetical protein